MNGFEVICALLNSAFNVLAAVLLFSMFAEGRVTRVRYGLMLVLSILLLTAVNLFVISNPLPVLFTITVTFLVSFVYRMKWFNRILSVCFSYSFAKLADIMTIMLINSIFNINLQETYIRSVVLMGIAWSKALLFVFVMLMGTMKRRFFSGFKWTMSYIMIIATISMITMLSLQYRRHYLHISLFAEVFWVNLVLNVVLIMSAVVILNMINELRGKAEEEAKLALIEKLLKGQEEQYRDMEKYGMDLLKIKHDQKNFLYGVLTALDHGNLADIRSSVVRELDTVESADVPADPSSNLVYHLVWGKMAEAEKYGVRLDCEYHDVKEIRISPIDFAIVLGNALDNAIEAAEKHTLDEKRKVSLIIKVKAGQIVVILKNYAPPETDVSDLHSGKTVPGHGFGILSMRNIVDHYDGELLFDLEEDMFTTYITLNNRSLKN